MAWSEDFSDSAVKGIGAVELLGALGVILPAATGIATTGGTVWPPVMWKSWSNRRYSLGSMSVRSALPSLSIGLPSSQVSRVTNMARWVGVV